MRVGLVFIFIIGAAQAAWLPTKAPTQLVAGPTNANKCLANLGTVQTKCGPTSGLLGLPTDLTGCCIALRQFAYRDSCACSPTIRTIMGVDGAGVSQLDNLMQLKLVCNLLRPLTLILDSDCSRCTAPSGIRTGACKTFNGGSCAGSDWSVENGRFISASGFGATFHALNQQPYCFNYPQFRGALAQFFDPDDLVAKTPYVQVSYGVGKYKNIEPMMEYLAMVHPLVNKNMWKLNVAQVQTADSFLFFKQDGLLHLS
jgi:hypothetical protein